MTLDDYVKGKQKKLEEIYQAHHDIIYEEEGESPDKGVSSSQASNRQSHFGSSVLIAAGVAPSTAHQLSQSRKSSREPPTYPDAALIVKQ
jgi:outer membrane biosynthesis protein TonB